MAVFLFILSVAILLGFAMRQWLLKETTKAIGEDSIYLSPTYASFGELQGGGKKDFIIYEDKRPNRNKIMKNIVISVIFLSATLLIENNIIALAAIIIITMKGISAIRNAYDSNTRKVAVSDLYGNE